MPALHSQTADQAAPVIYALHSLLEPIELSRLFSSQQPLEIELGSGDGSFLAAYAALHPGHNFIGIERLLGRLRKVERKTRRAGLKNVRGIRIESSYFLRYLLPSHCAVAIHIYFPDPWPKRKHERHRLLNENFPAIARRVLEPGGLVCLRTDDHDYFEQMTRVFAQAPEFERIQTRPELKAVLTDFEREFVARGIPTLHAAYQAKPAQTSITGPSPP